jgi:hypothetical protein
VRIIARVSPPRQCRAADTMIVQTANIRRSSALNYVTSQFDGPYRHLLTVLGVTRRTVASLMSAADRVRHIIATKLLPQSGGRPVTLSLLDSSKP